jgi:gas vesicle protein
MTKKDSGTGSFILGSLLGLLAGGITTMWMSPRSGDDRREDIQKIVVTFRSQAQQKVKDVVAKVQSLPPGKGDDTPPEI